MTCHLSLDIICSLCFLIAHSALFFCFFPLLTDGQLEECNCAVSTFQQVRVFA